MPDASQTPLGIAFHNTQGEISVGATFSCEFRLLAWPDPSCNRITGGVAFAIMEGTAVVGTGTIVSVASGV